MRYNQVQAQAQGGTGDRDGGPALRIDLPGLVKLKEKEAGTGGEWGYAAKLEVDTRTQNLAQVVAQLLTCGEVADITIADQPLEEIIAAIYTRSPGPPPERSRAADA